ncbi:FCD domain-containing protein [Streptomyces scopuliridis]|uniref:FCD domain-containing protein n=1 Tax=Streptomyces scopuliridis TaxID=452529 RepID=UPI0036739DF8
MSSRSTRRASRWRRRPPLAPRCAAQTWTWPGCGSTTAARRPRSGGCALHAEHEEMLRAIAAHDAEAARTATRSHLQRSLEQRIRSMVAGGGPDA